MQMYVRVAWGLALSLVTGGVVMQAPAGAPGESAVSIKLFQFQPSELTVRAGTRVTFKNLDQVEHTLHAGSPEHPTDDFTSRALGFDSTTSVVLKTPGRHEFYCDRHTFMRGEITVTK